MSENVGTRYEVILRVIRYSKIYVVLDKRTQKHVFSSMSQTSAQREADKLNRGIK
jgi:hypothetical protein